MKKKSDMNFLVLMMGSMVFVSLLILMTVVVNGINIQKFLDSGERFSACDGSNHLVELHGGEAVEGCTDG